MCSILAVLDLVSDAQALRSVAVEASKKQRHRGPDWSGSHTDDHAILVHERLAIVDIDNGAQPLKNVAGDRVLAVNGEIYNHGELERRLAAEGTSYPYRTRSDCEVILALYEKHGDAGFLEDLNGIFAFVLWDAREKRYLIGRDPIGVMPLYIGTDAAGNRWVASEMKALSGVCTHFEEFPPGHFLDSRVGEPTRYYAPRWRDYDAVAGAAPDRQGLRTALEQAVERQLMCDVPYGVLLSGGLDSSITAALARRHAARRVESGGRDEAWWPRLHSFCIGLEGSPDLAAAETAAEALGTVHHGFTYTIQDGLDALRDVIWHLETFDVTTIRASTPMMLMARRIKAMGIKMVLSGEGSDEVFGGYLYFHKAPNAREFHEETIRKLDNLSKFDCLRANKSMAAWGVEARVPFLDREFLDVAMGFDAKHKMCGPERMEKHLLRAAFEDLLPHEIAWRQKEQFSDGVGYGWIDTLKEVAEREVSDADFAAAAERFPRNPPRTKEGYFYRAIFEEHFPEDCAAACVPEGPSIACSTPTALRWEKAFADTADPSGRAVVGVHRHATG